MGIFHQHHHLYYQHFQPVVAEYIRNSSVIAQMVTLPEEAEVDLRGFFPRSLFIDARQLVLVKMYSDSFHRFQASTRFSHRIPVVENSTQHKSIV